MPEIKTEHRGYEIVYSDSDDEWHCYDLSMQAASLRRLKMLVDLHDRSVRKIGAFKAHLLDYHSSSEPVIITLLAEDDSRERGQQAYVTCQDKQRRKVYLENLVPDTVAAEAAISTWKAAAEAQRKAEAHVERCKKAIPRVTKKMLLEAKVAKAEGDT